MVWWVNDMVKKGGCNFVICLFKDFFIGIGVFFLDVFNGMKSSYVDYDFVILGQIDEDVYMNVKFSISIVCKFGVIIWLVFEDICQVCSCLVIIFIGK